jgi:hypothetical protein
VAARDPKPREIPVTPRTGEMVARGRANCAFQRNLLLLFLLIESYSLNKPIDAASVTVIPGHVLFTKSVVQRLRILNTRKVIKMRTEQPIDGAASN